MVMVYISTNKQEKNTMVNGKKVKKVEKGNFYSHKEIFMKENLIKVTKMVLEKSSTNQVQNLQEIL